MRGLASIASAFASLAESFGHVRNAGRMLLCVLIFFSSGLLPLFPQQTSIPEYSHVHSEDLGSAGVSSLDNIVISLDTDSQGTLYVLTFGGRLFKFNEEGEPIGTFNINVSSPVDLAISANDEIFVAGFDERMVYAFDLNGNPLPHLNKSSSYYRPLGLTFDSENNLYVVHYNDGTSAESDISSRLKIYYSDGRESGDLLENSLVQPYRIAVNSKREIFISQAGEEENGEVVIFSSTFEPLGTLPNMGSPGSIVIDAFDFVHVIDYADKLNFSRILAQDELYLLGAIGEIQDGIAAKEFSIKIFDAANTLVKTFKDKIELPLDLAFGFCSGKMYVNDSELTGSFFSTRLEFTLDVYNRTPAFDIEDPVANCIEPGKIFTLENGTVTITPEDVNNGSTDNCGIASMSLSQSTFSTPGDYSISLTVTDFSGNSDSCITSIKILTPVTELTIGCPDNELMPKDANCQVVVPDYTSLANPSNPEAVITQSPEGGTVIEEDTEITLTATFGELTATCKFQLQIIDRTHVEFDCPASKTDTYDSAVGYTLPDYTEGVSLQDNCDPSPMITQDPPPGTLIREEETEIVLRVEDASGNVSICRFFLTLTEETAPPSFECPMPGNIPAQELDEECKIAPGDLSGLLSSFENFSREPYFVQTAVQNVNILEVHIEVYDGEGGTFVGDCEFDIPLLDKTPPQIDCPGSPFDLSPDQNGKYTLPDFSDRASDTCDLNLEVTQAPPPGEITAGGTVTLFAVDDSGNASQTCEFEVVLVQEVIPGFDCPEFDALPQIVLDENCSYGDPDFTDQLKNFRNFKDSPLIVQSLQLIGNMLQVNLKVFDGDQKEESFVGECTFELQQIENIDPQAACVQQITVTLDENGLVRITPEEIDNGSTDGCGIVSYELSKDTFTSADIGNSPIEVELTVADPYENFDSCTVLVTVEPYDPGDPEPVNCVTSVTLPLDASGEARLDLELLYEGDLGSEGAVSVDKELFTCSDLGEQVVILQFTGNETTSCTLTVNVVDEIDPTALVKDIEIFLNENGTASITASDLDNGSTDNCGTGGLELTVSQTRFSCPDLGLNAVSFTVTDDSGNSSTVSANVTVLDPLNHCTVDPVEPPENSYVVLFPNPSRGQVQIAASSEILLQRVEIFDVRGRFMNAVELFWDPATGSYHLNLQQYQTGMYTLKIYSNEREYIRRAIITTF